ncbi:MAG: hypothetical protein U1A72_19945 [Sulfuritalea sp.]|nr:hypothetical protein [Sulfuritalea sp.]
MAENKITTAVKCRDDLSFTWRNEGGRLINWNVPHDPRGKWDDGRRVGRQLFGEVESIAGLDELEAFRAISFAMNNPGWRPTGWGIEIGFTEALAAAAIIGLRVIRDGADRYDFEGEAKKELQAELAEANSKPSNVVQLRPAQ